MSNSNKFRTTEQAIKNFISVHGEEYDYSKYIYLNNREKGIISCVSHGEFMMSYEKHFDRKQKCPNCAKNKKQDTAKCLEFFNSVHGDRYDYSDVVYTGNRNKVKIRCKEHGFFEQEPFSHKAGRNCPRCSIERSRTTWHEALAAFLDVHGNYYEYFEESYTKMSEKIKIKCQLHGEFYQRASQHAAGKGCKKCTMYYGWGKSPYLSRSSKYGGRSHLYICRMTNSDENFIKVGIAYDGFKSRYKLREKRNYNIDLIVEYSGEAELIWDLETQILRSMSQYKYKPLIKFDGASECLFDIDNSVFACLNMLCNLGYLSE